MPAHTGSAGIGNIVDGVGAPGVLGQRAVAEVRTSRLIKHHILKDSTRFMSGSVDQRLLLFRQIDGLGVTAPFKIENTVIAPAMLIVTYQYSVGVGREGS